MSKPVQVTTQRKSEWSAYSQLSESGREESLKGCCAVTGSICPGLDVEREIRAVQTQGLGETVLLHDGRDLVGFAVCHCGPGTEAGHQKCYVKFGAVKPGAAAEAQLDQLWIRRFESRKTGKAGYAPACANEWIKGICEKPRIKCANCPNRRFLPVTDEVIRWHLSGQDGEGQPFVAGVYPLLLDETCFFLAVDFDKAAWEEDAVASGAPVSD
jgi:hypothetical protein